MDGKKYEKEIKRNKLKLKKEDHANYISEIIEWNDNQ